MSSFVLALSVVEVQCIQIILSDLEGASAEVTLLTALKHRESLAAENTAALLVRNLALFLKYTSVFCYQAE